MKFPFFGVPVTIHWSFLIVALIGIQIVERPIDVIGWTLAVFIAVLIHEAGHAFTARAYGADNVAITIFALGGLTSWLPKPTMGPLRRFIVSAAGTAAGIAVGLLALTVVDFTVFGITFGNDTGLTGVTWAFFRTIVLVGLIWGLFNWLPMLPLDGGHMLQHALTIFAPKRADQVTRVVSLVTGGALIAGSLYIGSPLLAIFIGFMLFSGLRSLPGTPAPPQRPAEPPPAEPSSRQERDQEPPAFPI